jgi:hypothetical protein
MFKHILFYKQKSSNAIDVGQRNYRNEIWLHIYISFFIASRTDWIITRYSQTCIKRSPLGQRKSGLIRQVTSYKRFNQLMSDKEIIEMKYDFIFISLSLLQVGQIGLLYSMGVFQYFHQYFIVMIVTMSFIFKGNMITKRK